MKIISFFLLFFLNTTTLSAILFFCWMKTTKFLTHFKIKQKRALERIQDKQAALQQMLQQTNDKLDKIQLTIKDIQSNRPIDDMPRNSIEHNYQRIKSLLKQGVSIESEALNNMNVTEEEFQLLTNHHTHHETNI